MIRNRFSGAQRDSGRFKKRRKRQENAAFKRRCRERKVAAGQNLTHEQPDYEGECENCGASPVVPSSGMCGPCTFGEAETAGGEW